MGQKNCCYFFFRKAYPRRGQNKRLQAAHSPMITFSIGEPLWACLSLLAPFGGPLVQKWQMPVGPNGLGA